MNTEFSHFTTLGKMSVGTWAQMSQQPSAIYTLSLALPAGPGRLEDKPGPQGAPSLTPTQLHC